MNKISILGILGVLVLVVAFSGCTSTPTNVTFTDGKMSFNYPSDFKNSTSPGVLVAGHSSWQNVTYMANGEGISIKVQKNNVAGFTPGQASNATETSVKESNGTIVSTSTETNPNGVEIVQNVFTLADPSANSTVRFYDMNFLVNGEVYGITVSGNDTDNGKILEVKNTVFNTIKIS